jgi:large subunit ribosomal protein L22
MQVIATQKFIRQTPRKLRLVAGVVRGMPVPSAFEQLSKMNKRATVAIAKVLRQAVANASHNFRLSPMDLHVKELQVTEGPRYRRYQAASRGRAHSIIKRTSHVRIIVGDVAKVDANLDTTKAKTK